MSNPLLGFCICQSRPSVSSHVGGLSSPSWFGFKHRRLCTLQLDLISPVSCKSRVGSAELADSSGGSSDTGTGRDKSTPPAGARPSVLSLMAPMAPPLPKRHFCNSMQASELCHKVLVSLKADLSSKVGAGSMGSALRLRSEGFLWENV